VTGGHGSTPVAGDVWLGDFTTEELLVAGFDDVGLLQPLLISSDSRPGESALAEAARGLRERGLLVPHGSGWRTAGPLEVVLYGRAAGPLTAEVLGTDGANPLRRHLIFGLLTAGGEQLLAVDIAGTDGTRHRCRTCRRDEEAARIVAATLGNAADVSDGDVEGEDARLEIGGPSGTAGAFTRIEACRINGPEKPPAIWRVGLTLAPQGPRLIVGYDADGTRTGWTRITSRATATVAIAAALAGETPRP
jgi:hypothetical protein